MFDNTRFSNMDEAVICVLNLLARIADTTEPRNCNFDEETFTYKPKKRKKARLRNFFLLTNWKKYFSIGLAFFIFEFSILTIAILVSKASKDPHIAKESWFVPIIYFLLGIALCSLVLYFVLIIIKNWESNKYPAWGMIDKAREEIIAYQPVIQKLCEIEKNRQQTLKSAESIIKSLIDNLQVGEKNISNSLPILVPSLIAIIIVFIGFPIQLPGNSSFYNAVLAIVAIGTPFIPVFKFINELGAQYQILKFKKCLLLLEQAQARANDTNQQAIPTASTKPRPQFGSARGLIEMSDDFDAPLADFKDYMT